MLNILILGASGMAGHMISDHLGKKRGSKYNILELHRNPSKRKNSIIIENFQVSNILDIVKLSRIDVIINCIGILNEKCNLDPTLAYYWNGIFPNELAQKLTTIFPFCRLIQISTDCVFSGTKGDYKEFEHKDGNSIYAISKSMGEVNYGHHLTIRTSIIGPELKTDGIGLFDWFIFNQSNQVFGFSDHYWSGVTTLELSNFIDIFISNKIYGLLHLSNNSKISKLNLLKTLNTVFLNESKNIIPKNAGFVDKSLINSRLDFNLAIDYANMIKDLYIWMKSNKYTYVKYSHLI